MIILSIIAFCSCEDGATAIEYAVIATLLGMACVFSLTILGTTISSFFSNITPYLSV